jgi:hypothetical protein
MELALCSWIQELMASEVEKEVWTLAEKIKSKRVTEITETGQSYNKNKSNKECFVEHQ